MRKTLVVSFVLPLLAALVLSVISACYIDECDDECDDDNDDNDDNDDIPAADDDTAGYGDDDDTLGLSPEAEACINRTSQDYQSCKAACPDQAVEAENVCDHYHCIASCNEQMFLDSLACAEQHPELAGAVPFWNCNLGCEQNFLACLDPVSQCDLDSFVACLETSQECQASCFPY